MKMWFQNMALAFFGVFLSLFLITLLLQNQSLQERLETTLDQCVPEADEVIATIEVMTQFTRIDMLPCVSFTYKDEPDAEFTNLIRYNNFGFHDMPRRFDNPDGRPRLLFLGDSFVMGNEARMEDGFPHLVEENLRTAAGEPVEVINMGVQTLSTGSELGLYSALGWRFNPDVVVLFFYMGNDIWDDTFANPVLTFDEAGGLAFNLKHMPFDPAAFPESPAYQWLIDAVQRGIASQQVPLKIVQRDYLLEELGLYLAETDNPAYGEWEHAWAMTQTMLLQFRDLVEAQGSRFAVVILPDRRAVYQAFRDVTFRYFPDIAPMLDFFAPYGRLEAFLNEQGIPVLNLRDALESRAVLNPDFPLYFWYDGHFTPDGHRVTAEAVTAWLMQSGLLETRR